MKTKHTNEFIECPICNALVYSADFNSDTNECDDCHDAGQDPMDCRCDRCVDNAVGKADFYDAD